MILKRRPYHSERCRDSFDPSSSLRAGFTPLDCASASLGVNRTSAVNAQDRLPTSCGRPRLRGLSAAERPRLRTKAWPGSRPFWSAAAEACRRFESGSSGPDGIGAPECDRDRTKAPALHRTLGGHATLDYSSTRCLTRDVGNGKLPAEGPFGCAQGKLFGKLRINGWATSECTALRYPLRTNTPHVRETLNDADPHYHPD